MRLDYEELSAGKAGMLIVIATGTPVVLENWQPEKKSGRGNSNSSEEVSFELKRTDFDQRQGLFY